MSVQQSSGFGLQSNGSIVNKDGLIINPAEARNILSQVNALPVMQERDRIIELIGSGKNLIIDAATGSGKSTLVPVFAREATGKKVVQTVPRVLSAMTLGEWISKYLLCRTGDPEYTLGYKEIGYRTGSGSSSSHTSNLSIHTDGLEMMRELYSEIFPDVLILDEVQNLSIATEILLFIHKNRIDTQIIIMSATLDPKLYEEYMKVSGRRFETIKIPGKVFPISEEMNSQGTSIDKSIELAKMGKHVLHIVSGKSRIDKVMEELNKELGPGYEIMPLHAEMTQEEQFRVIINPQENITRIIIATNVAEESITIPYLNAVVDEGTHKVLYVNEQGIPELRIEPVTQANTLQRRGRVGRTQIGEYFRFSPYSFGELNEYPSAAIERTLLMREILLFAKAGKPLYSIISRAQDKGKEAFLHPVNKSLLNIGIERLEQIGALDTYGNITALGEDMLTIPLEVNLSRMIIEGIKRGVCEEMITIASIFSVNSFLSKDGKWKEIQPGENKKSDMFLYLDLYDLVTKTQINRDILARLVYPLGLDAEQVAEFDKIGNTKPFFEIVDLSPIGIKNHRIAQIYNKVIQIQNSLIERGIQIDKKKKISGKQIFIKNGEDCTKGILDAIFTSIASGYPYFTFGYNPQTKRFTQTKIGDSTITDIEFRRANISSVTPSPDGLYIGVPFVIGSDEVGEDMGLEGKENFFDSHETIEGDDLCIISHLTEISEGNLKEALLTQRNYESPFPIRKTKQLNNLEDLNQTYNSLCADYSSGYISKKDFLINAVAILLMLKHKKFNDFIIGKSGETIRTLQHRLNKFFDFNTGDYIHRIGRTLDAIEASFIGDAEIYNNFRDWEQKNITNQKKQRKKHIPERDAEEIENQFKTHQINLRLQEEIGLFQGLVNSFSGEKFQNVVSRFLSHFSTELLGKSRTLNTAFSVFEDEIKTLSDEDRKKAIASLNQAENSDSQLTSIRTRISQLKSTIIGIQSLLLYTTSPNRENYNCIDFEKIRQDMGLQKNNDTLSRSQKNKFYNSITAIQIHHTDSIGNQKNINALTRAKNSFTSIHDELKRKLEEAEAKLHQKAEEIELKKANTFKTRTELVILFTKLYEDQYYQTVIEKKIPHILRELFETKDFQYTIDRWICQEFDSSKLKSMKGTERIHFIYGIKRRIEEKISSIQKCIDSHNKKENPSCDEIQSCLDIVKEGRKILGDYKSQLYCQ